MADLMTAEATAAEPAAEEVATEAVAPALDAAAAVAETAAVATPVPAPEPAPAPAPVPADELPAAATAVSATLTNGGAAASVPEPEKETPAPSTTETEPEPAAAPASEPEPEQLPLNGLSLEELKPEVPEENIVESKPEPPAAETVEIVPAPEIPIKEVCVQQMPLLDSTPPPLPANPPPSSVASFAATTMAPELTDASMPNTADTAVEPLSALPNTPLTIDQVRSLTPTFESDATELPSPLKETSEDMPLVADSIQPELPTEVTSEIPKAEEPEELSEVEVVPTAEDINLQEIPVILNGQIEPSQEEETKEQRDKIADKIEVNSESIPKEGPIIESSPESKMEETLEPNVEQTPEPEIEQIPEPSVIAYEIDDTPLPPPPAEDDIEMELNLGQNGNDDLEVIPGPMTEPEEIIDSNHVSVLELTNGVDEISLEEKSVTVENTKNKAKAIAFAVTENGVDKMECNGEAECREVIVTEPTPAANEAVAAATCTPLPTSSPAAHTPQEPVSVSDKLADLIPEVPDVPEINTETLQVTATDVAVAN